MEHSIDLAATYLGFGVVIPVFGSRSLNVEDTEDLREQRKA